MLPRYSSPESTIYCNKGLQINPLPHLIEPPCTKTMLSLPWPGVVVFVCNIEEGGERVLKEKDVM